MNVLNEKCPVRAFSYKNKKTFQEEIREVKSKQKEEWSDNERKLLATDGSMSRDPYYQGRFEFLAPKLLSWTES